MISLQEAIEALTWKYFEIVQGTGNVKNAQFDDTMRFIDILRTEGFSSREMMRRFEHYRGTKRSLHTIFGRLERSYRLVIQDIQGDHPDMAQKLHECLQKHAPYKEDLPDESHVAPQIL